MYRSHHVISAIATLVLHCLSRCCRLRRPWAIRSGQPRPDPDRQRQLASVSLNSVPHRPIHDVAWVPRWQRLNAAHLDAPRPRSGPSGRGRLPNPCCGRERHWPHPPLRSCWLVLLHQTRLTSHLGWLHLRLGCCGVKETILNDCSHCRPERKQ